MKCALHFFKALSQYTMCDIYAQVMVQFMFRIMNGTVHTLHCLPYFKYVLTIETATCLHALGRPIFFHFTHYTRKQTLVAYDKMQDPDYISHVSAWQTLCFSLLWSQSCSVCLSDFMYTFLDSAFSQSQQYYSLFFSPNLYYILFCWCIPLPIIISSVDNPTVT